ncbi:GGDEF domain-containing response regulator [Leadbettera azotonutricia]|uniref:diguanylate cyclase n=1 Tax=Leadbettera azotonutricia (strain ATCC BAA-888 / DSM 13862 / ZAS-9) TaxID=545695 RepID=F5Y8V2_LEAAZ|nr:diguanylate cyclase [Leadbettera azotonutricia]AEF81051.1 two-component response regulator [Leadbettera azotonutricia ZAS-9]
MESSKKYSVLIVDDEKSDLMLLNRVLSPEYTVFTAKSGTEALSRTERDKPDLILLDIIMPDISGFDVLVQLKEAPATRNIPVIIITGLTSEDDEEKGLFLGAVDYIAKPFKNAIVRARVSTHLQILHHIRTIEHLGLIDPLTDIPNRRSFDDRMAMEWRRAIREKLPISFLMMDVDKFKTYNDTYGHPQGDVLLQTLARIFAGAARRPSDLAARLGGEEFGVLLSNTSAENAKAIAERIRAEVEAMRVPTVDGKTITTATISIGATTCFPADGDNSKDFISKADENLYSAKTNGRNRVVGD